MCPALRVPYPSSYPDQEHRLAYCRCRHRHWVRHNNIQQSELANSRRIWLTDLADKLPKSVCLDALEVSFDAIPLPDMLPPNMSLHHWDIKADVPENLVGVYDIVNIRHFAFVLQEPELKGVVHRLLRLLSMFSAFLFHLSYVICIFGFLTYLEPGGYLQWTDIDVNSLRLEKIRPEIQAGSQIKLMNIFKGDDTRLRPAWVPTLPTLFAEGGLVDVATDIKEAPPYLALALHECGLLATEVLARNKTGNEEAILKQALSQAAKETRDGSYLAFTRHTVIGQKKQDTM